MRGKALRFAGDVSYLELGDYPGALSYYRRIVSLQPGGPAAWEPRPLPLPPDGLSIRVSEDRLSLAWRPPTARVATPNYCRCRPSGRSRTAWPGGSRAA